MKSYSIYSIYQKAVSAAEKMDTNITKYRASYPFLSLMDGQYMLSFFFCSQTAEQNKRQMVSCMDRQMFFNISSGIIEAEVIIPYYTYNEFYIGSESCNKPAINFQKSWVDLLTEICTELLENRILNEKRYYTYLSFILDCVPDELRDIYYALGVYIHKEFPIINAITKLPKFQNINYAFSFYSQCNLYILLDKNTAREWNGNLSAEPAVIVQNKKRTVFISNDKWCIWHLAMKYKMYCGDIPLAGEIVPYVQYDNFVQFLKYVYTSYADSIIFFMLSENKTVHMLHEFYPDEALKYLGEDPKACMLLSLEASSKKLVSNGKYHKLYSVSPYFKISDTKSGVFYEDRISKKEIKKLQIRIESGSSVTDLMESLGILYILTNMDTQLPYIDMDFCFYAFTSSDDLQKTASYIQSEYNIRTDSVRVSHTSFEDVFYSLCMAEGFQSVILNNNIKIPIRQMLCHTDKKDGLCPQVKSCLTLYSQWKKSGRKKEEKCAFLKLLCALSRSMLIVPVIDKESDVSPVPIILMENGRRNTVFQAYTDMRELKNMNGIQYTKAVQIKAANISVSWDSFVVNAAGSCPFEIQIKKYIYIMKCFSYMADEKEEDRMEKAVTIAEFPEIAEEFCYVCRERKFKRTKVLKINGNTAEDLCRRYSMTVQTAYYLMALFIKDKQKADTILKNLS